MNIITLFRTLYNNFYDEMTNAISYLWKLLNNFILTNHLFLSHSMVIGDYDYLNVYSCENISTTFFIKYKILWFYYVIKNKIEN